MFCKGIFRELLTQLAEKLKEVMEHALSKNVHLTLNRHLNNYQRALMLEQLDVDKMIPSYLQSKD